MHLYELTALLGDIPGTKISIRRGALHVQVPAIDDTARLDPDDIVDAEPAFVPTGAPAVRLDVRRGHEMLPLIVTVDDVVFSPAYADSLIRSTTELRVPAMPSLIAYSEMHRDVRALGRAIDEPGAQLDRDMLAATLLAHRCYLAGATRVGLRPVRVAAWWEYTHAQTRGRVADLALAPDPVWDDLMDAVTRARQQSPTTVD